MGNKIIKCVEQSSHGRHILTSDMVKRMAFIEARYPAARLPVCGGCERLALWSKNAGGEGVGVCEKCGTITAGPVTYGEYLAMQYGIKER